MPKRLIRFPSLVNCFCSSAIMAYKIEKIMSTLRAFSLYVSEIVEMLLSELSKIRFPVNSYTFNIITIDFFNTIFL